MDDGLRGVLEVTAGMPERHLEAGEHLFDQGAGQEHSVAVLVSGVLQVHLDDVAIDAIDVPGAFIGEIGALLGTARSANVSAKTPAVVRVIGNPDAFFGTNPEVALELARQLARKHHRLLAYLGDLRTQYADSEGHLSFVDSVLGRLASRPAIEIEPGSERSPDY
jgi:CRP-like cAMP-binding protein